ncbi:MAG: hypothetical protein ACC656_09130, partial [Candidatus Heimdallarchaeota archaeon]
MPQLSDFSDIQVGSNPVNEVYVGNTLVWTRAEFIPFTMTQDTSIGTTLEGWYNCSSVETTINIDWGDGTIDSNLLAGTYTHVYAVNSIYTIIVHGVQTPYFNDNPETDKIITITSIGDAILRDSSFRGAINMTSFNMNNTIPYTHPNSDILTGCFRDCESLNEINFKDWDLSLVTSFFYFLRSTFKNNTNITTTVLDLSTVIFPANVSFNGFLIFASFITSVNFPDMSGKPMKNLRDVFNSCFALTSVPNIETFKGTSSVVNFLKDCTSYLDPAIDLWDITEINDYTGFATNVTWDVNHYQNVLNAWAVGNPMINQTPDFGNNRANQTGRPGHDTLIDTFGWTITDLTTRLEVISEETSSVELSWNTSGTFDVEFTLSSVINWQLYGSGTSPFWVTNLDTDTYLFRINGN